MEATGRTSGNAFRRPARPGFGICVALCALARLWVVHSSDENPYATVDVPAEGDDIKKAWDESFRPA